MKELKISSELRDFIPPLSGEEKKALEDSLLKYGYKGAPIYTWNNYIVDGHNRYELCRKHNIDYSIEELGLGDEATIIDVMEWMINTQLGRRNLSPQQRLALVEKFKKKIQEKAKYNQSIGFKINGIPIHTDKEIAKLALVGIGTVARYNRVMNSNDEELKKSMLANQISINAAYQKILTEHKESNNIAHQDNILQKYVNQDSTIVIPCKLLSMRNIDLKNLDLCAIYNLAKNWIDSLCSPIDVCFKDGQYKIIDGEKRYLAKLMLDKEATILCHLYCNLGEYKKSNYKYNKSMFLKGDHIINCVCQAGFSLDYFCGHRENTFTCVRTLEKIYDGIGDYNFIDMLNLLKNVCNGNKYSIQANFIKGFAKFYYVYKSSILESELKKVFVDSKTKKVTKDSFDKIKEKSQLYKQSRDVGVTMAFGLLMRYNECCLPKNKLSLGVLDSIYNV